METHDFKKFPELTNTQMQEWYFLSPHKQINEDFVARVIKVHDGDTITLNWAERDFNFPIRFINIAAPELNEIGGKEAQSWLESQILKQEVEIKINNANRVDKWGRLLGNVLFNGLDLGETEIHLGLALPWSQVSEQNPIPNINQILEKAWS